MQRHSESAGGTDDILDRSLYPYGSIPMHNGIDVDGFPQLFDLDFVLEQTIETYGSGAHISFSPVYEDNSLQVRPIIGGRFFRIRESMNFRGVDSGLDYLPDLPDGVDDDDDFVIDNVEENGTLNFTDRTPNIDEEILVRSFVSSQVRSTMGGPEIGFEYTVGERGSLSLNGSTRVGALFNHEKATLAGDNIGDTLTTDLVERNNRSCRHVRHHDSEWPVDPKRLYGQQRHHARVSHVRTVVPSRSPVVRKNSGTARHAATGVRNIPCRLDVHVDW